MSVTIERLGQDWIAEHDRYELARSKPVSTTRRYELIDPSTASARATGAPLWWERVTQQLVDIARLPANWNGYDERPLSQALVTPVIALLSDLRLAGLPGPCPSPLADGGLQLDWGPNGEIVVEFAPDGRAIALLPDQDICWALDERAGLTQLFNLLAPR